MKILKYILLFICIQSNAQVITLYKDEIKKGAILETIFNLNCDSMTFYVKCDTAGTNDADYYIDERKITWDRPEFVKLIEGGSMIDMVQVVLYIDVAKISKELDNKFRNLAKLEIIGKNQYYITVASDQRVGMTGQQIYSILVEYPDMELIGVTEFKKIRDAVKK